MKLKLTNNVSKIESVYDVTDVGDSMLYYHFENFVLDGGLPDGEYSYLLFDDKNTVVAQGLCQIGDYEREETTIYDNNKPTYKQYNS